MELMAGMSRPAWHGCGPCSLGIDSSKLLLTALGMSRAWGGWKSIEKWGLLVWGLDAIFSGEAAELLLRCGSRGD